jgi:translation elongation factor EF-Tu-like GTPase
MGSIIAAIEERFQIADRGTAVVIGQVTSLPVGKPLRATVSRPDGSRLSVEAFKEWLLRRDRSPPEVEAFLLKGVAKSDVPEGSTIELEAI